MRSSALMTELDRLLSEFIDAWNAGEAPAVEDYLDRAGDDADELATMIAGFLDVAPPPPYSDKKLTELRRDPLVRASVEALSGESGLLPSLLPRLRDRARLRRDEVVARLARALGMAGEEERTARYLHGLEAGTLPSAGVSRRVLDALAGILGASGDELERAADMPGLATPEIAGAYLRAESGAEPGGTPADHARLPAPEDWDELDRLFLGGRG
jgi:hypothetical protein